MEVKVVQWIAYSIKKCVSVGLGLSKVIKPGLNEFLRTQPKTKNDQNKN
jgi:hypothetical protein